MSSPSPDVEFARTLLGKAREDHAALEVLHGRSGIADAILGFHGQQTVEKALKALLVGSGWELRRTHDLQFLVDECSRMGIELSESLLTSGWLTPWAAELRYDEFSDEPLDRDRVRILANEAVAAAQGHVEDLGSSRGTDSR